MSRIRLVLDGKWASICPQLPPRTAPARVNPVLRHITLSRQYSASTQNPLELHGLSSVHTAHKTTSRTDSQNVDDSLEHEFSRAEKRSAPRDSTKTPVRSVPKPVDANTVASLEEQLYGHAARPDLPAVVSTLRQLVLDHDRQPCAAYYKAWVLANCDPVYGSALKVRQIWDEIWSEDVTIGSDVFHAFIKVGLASSNA